MKLSSLWFAGLTQLVKISSMWTKTTTTSTSSSSHSPMIPRMSLNLDLSHGTTTLWQPIGTVTRQSRPDGFNWTLRSASLPTHQSNLSTRTRIRAAAGSTSTRTCWGIERPFTRLKSSNNSARTSRAPPRMNPIRLLPSSIANWSPKKPDQSRIINTETPSRRNCPIDLREGKLGNRRSFRKVILKINHRAIGPMKRNLASIASPTD